MMQKISQVGQLNMRHRMIQLSTVISILLLLLLITPYAMADYIYLKPGQSKTVDSKATIDTVFVSNPAVADYKIISDKRLVVYGKMIGLSDITVYGADNRVLSKITIEVDPILGDLAYRIKRAFPGSDVRIQRLTLNTGSKATYLLSGSVPDEETGDLIYRIVGETVGTEGTDYEYTLSSSSVDSKLEHMTRKSYRNIIKKFTYPRPAANQVSVALVIVEVSKEFTDALGIEWNQITKTVDGENDTFGSNGQFQLIDFKGFDAKSMANTIHALKNDKLAKVLASPTLTVLSGEVADFLVGGEVPITIRDSTNNSVSTSYKQHGIMLSIAPKVMNDNKIKLTLANELSNTDQVSSNSEYFTPTFQTRRSTSTIELANGQSFVIAGLLKEEDSETVSKIPFIGDLPIIGALARSTETNRRKTELVIFVTVTLVGAVDSVAEIDIPKAGKTSSTKLFFNVGIDKAARENRLLNNNPMVDPKAVNFLDRGGFDK